MAVFTVIIESAAGREREALRYSAETTPEIGETIIAEGVAVVVTNLLRSIDPESDEVQIEAERAIDRKRAASAADAIETALAAHGHALPTNLLQNYRAAATILRDGADPDTPESNARNALARAARQLQTPQGVFLPAELTRSLDAVRSQIDRALNGI